MDLSPPPGLAAAEIALFLDFDGTLIPYASGDLMSPAVDPALPGLLGRLATRTGGAAALVSGRGIAEIDALLKPTRLAMSGTHGAELRAAPDAAIEIRFPGGALARLAERCEAWAAGRPGVLLERKYMTLVLHFHGLTDVEGPAEAFAEAVCREIGGFVPAPGRGLIEFKPAGADKGAGIRALMELSPFAGRRPVFVGDDLPDEPGFAAVMAMDGVAIRVGAGASVAPHRLPDTRAVHAWLAAIA